MNASSIELAPSWHHFVGAHDVPPTVSEHIGECCAAIAAADDSRDSGFRGAHIQGIYLEGPFFTMKHMGAQNPEYLIDPSYEVFKGWQEKAGGRIVKSALAPRA